MEDLRIETLRSWAEDNGFDTFCELMAKYLPADSKENRRQAREIYDLLKKEEDNAKILSTLEEFLEDREKKGLKKGLVIGGVVGGGLIAGLAALLLRREE